MNLLNFLLFKVDYIKANFQYKLSLEESNVEYKYSYRVEADINVKMIDQGSDELNIILGIEESDFEKAMSAIYSEFVN